jgi:hypothetical protein
MPVISMAQILGSATGETPPVKPWKGCKFPAEGLLMHLHQHMRIRSYEKNQSPTNNMGSIPRNVSIAKE